MTAAAVFAVLWPLARGRAAVRGGSDRLIYQDQLREVDRDRAAGLIGEGEAETARVEISRRLLAAADAEAQAVSPTAAAAARHRRVAAIAVIAIVPLVALGFYFKLGSPDVPGQSAFARATPHDDRSIQDLVSEAEAHLARNPNDGTGWEILGATYMRLGRYDDAVAARRKSIVLNGDTATRESDLGEAVVAAAHGVVTAEAKQNFQKALAADPHNAQAQYFLGLADDQDGNRAAAATKWRALLEQAPPDAPYVDFVRQELVRVGGTPPALSPSTRPPAAANGPSAADVAASEAMPEAERETMVRGMVQRLADRLHHDGGGVQDWLRLVQAYAVLGDRDKAKDAAADARHALSAHPDEVKQIDDLVKGLGLES